MPYFTLKFYFFSIFLGAPGFFRGRSTQTLHDSINKGFICMSGRIVVPLRHLI